MRSLMFLLLLVLFCTVLKTSRATEAIRSAESVCCEGFTEKNIPLKRIVSYQWTTSNCAIKAIVFKTVAGKEICVDPKDSLVSKQVGQIDKRTSSARTTTHASTSSKASGSTSATTTTHASTSSKASGSTSATTTAASTAKTPDFK